MAIMVYSLLWVMQDVYHQPWDLKLGVQGFRLGAGSELRQRKCWLVEGFSGLSGIYFGARTPEPETLKP